MPRPNHHKGQSIAIHIVADALQKLSQRYCLLERLITIVYDYIFTIHEIICVLIFRHSVIILNPGFSRPCITTFYSKFLQPLEGFCPSPLTSAKSCGLRLIIYTSEPRTFEGLWKCCRPPLHALPTEREGLGGRSGTVVMH